MTPGQDGFPDEVSESQAGPGFSPWIESILRGDENRYADSPEIRSLVLDSIALRLKIQEDLEKAGGIAGVNRAELEKDLKIASKKMQELERLACCADECDEPDMSKEIQKLTFSLSLHRSKLESRLQEKTGSTRFVPKGSAPLTPYELPVKKRRKQNAGKTADIPSKAEPRIEIIESPSPRLIREERKIPSLGMIPVLLLLTITFFVVLKFTGERSAGKNPSAKPTAASPYDAEIQFASARCDDTTFYGNVTDAWNTLSPGQKMDALYRLRKKLLKDSIREGILTDGVDRKTASWNLETMTLYE
jgi:hypothetical protein